MAMTLFRGRYIAERKMFFWVNECKFLCGCDTLFNCYPSSADTILMENLMSEKTY